MNALPLSANDDTSTESGGGEGGGVVPAPKVLAYAHVVARLAASDGSTGYTESLTAVVELVKRWEMGATADDRAEYRRALISIASRHPSIELQQT